MVDMKPLLVTYIVFVFADEGHALRGEQQLGQISTSLCAPNPPCDPFYPYRTSSGICSNMLVSSWAWVYTPFFRWLPAYYADGISSPRKSVTGSALPAPREISTACFPDHNVPDQASPLNLMQWGQMVAHDTSKVYTADKVFPYLQCCSSNGDPLALLGQQNGCLPIEVSSQDTFYSQYDVSCIFFARGVRGLGNCPFSPAEKSNGVTHVIDASFVYGSNPRDAAGLREFSGGRLKVYTTPDGREWPLMSSSPQEECYSPNENVCYSTKSDTRINQNTGMTLYTILFYRLHNYLAGQLCILNPDWIDEILYQEARRIVWAVIQNITYKQFLPIMLGQDYLIQRGILDEEYDNSCINFFDPIVTPSTFVEWSVAGFRSFHSLVPRQLVFYNEEYVAYNVTYLDDWYFRPNLLQDGSNLDDLTRGMIAQPQESQDQFVSTTLTEYLYREYSSPYGQDLVSIDIQRGRDLGLPTYNDFRQLCGFKRAKTFEDFADFMNENSIQSLQSFYASVDDVDLYVGGLMENLIPGTYVGPTFQCINGEQFYDWMRGDQWYYENCGMPISFSKEQITALYATTPAWVFCTVGDNIQSVQYDTFHLPSDSNPVVPCCEIPQLDLTSWKEGYLLEL